MEETNKQNYKKIPYWSWILVHCPNCESDWEPGYRLWWYKWLNIVLLVLWIIPWVFYLIRRCMNCVCVCKKCGHEKLWEINWDIQLIKKLRKIQHMQNLCYWWLIIIFIFIVLDIIIKFS